MSTRMKRLIKAVALSLALTTGGSALPEGVNVTHGTATISTSGSTQTIQQSSNKAIINWNGFNIDVGELVHFVQPNSTSAVLNRVIGQDPSQILGAMRANGQVFLINPNGVVFGNSAQIDVGSLVVSTLNISDNDFLEGRLHFEQQPDKELAAVINQGTITIDDNGFLVLTGPMVANEGLVIAKVGQVALAGGTTSTVSFDPTGLLQLELPAGSDASEGIVSLTQESAGDLLSSVVASSTIQAGQLVERNGQTYLEVEAGTVVNTGEIVAEGSQDQRGGRIVLDSTANTLLADTSYLSVSGQGLNSDGGEVYILSDEAAESTRGSRIEARSGLSGDGGFVEQSAPSVTVGVLVDALAPEGEHGTFLIDPVRLLVETGAGTAAPDSVAEDTLEAMLVDVVLTADQGIDFEFLNGGELTIMPGLDLTLDIIVAAMGPVTPQLSFSNPGDILRTQGSGDFFFTSVRAGGGGGRDIFDLNVTTDTGNITVTAASGEFPGINDLVSNTGNITVNAPASSFIGPTRFYTEGLVSVTSSSTNLNVTAPGLLTGTNSAMDITVRRDTGSIDMGGVTNVGMGFVAVRANTVTQSNQLLTNTGDFGFAPATNSVGTALNPIRIDGSVSGGAVGDMFLESVTSLDLLGLSATNLTGTGASFTTVGPNSFSNSASLTATSTIDGFGVHLLSAPTLSLTATEIGSGGLLETSQTTLNVTADNVNMIDQQMGFVLGTLTGVNTAVGATSWTIDHSSPGMHLTDNGTLLDVDAIATTLNYTTTGDRATMGFVGPTNTTLTLNQDGGGNADLSGTIDGATNFTATADDINISVGVAGFGNFTGTANDGDIVLNSAFSGLVNVVSATANAVGGDVNIAISGPLTTSGTGITAAQFGIVSADSIGTVPTPALITAPTLDLVSTTGVVNVSSSAPAIAVSGNAFGGSSDFTVVNTGGGITTSAIMGDNVIVNAGPGGGVTSALATTITGLTSLSLSGPTGLNVTTATPSLSAAASGPVVISNTAASLTADIMNPTSTIDLTNTGTILVPFPTNSLTGTQVTVTGDTLGNVGALQVNTPDLLATSTAGDINVALNGPGPTAVTAIANGGLNNVTIGSNAAIQARDIQGATVMVTGGLAGPTITSISNSILAGTSLTVASMGAIDIDTQSPDVFVTSAGTVRVDNVGAAAIRVSAPPSAVTITNTGALTTTSMSGTSLDITAPSFSGTGVTAATLAANATGPGPVGDLTISGSGDSALTLAATDDITVTGFTNLTGSSSGDIVTLTASGTINGTATGATRVNATGTAVTLGVTTSNLDLDATAGDATITGINPNLMVEATATGNVSVTNVGNITPTMAFSGVDLTLSTLNSGNIGFDGVTITGSNSVVLSAVNAAQLPVNTPSLTATLTGASPTAITGNSATMDVNLTHANDITLQNSGNITVTGITSPTLVTINDPSNSNSLTTNVAGSINAGGGIGIDGFSTVTLDTQTPTAAIVTAGNSVVNNTGPLLAIIFGHDSLVAGPSGTLNVSNTGDLTVSRIANDGDVTVTSGGHVEATRDPLDPILDGFFTAALGFNPGGRTLTSNMGTVTVSGTSANLNTTTDTLMATTTAGNLVINAEAPSTTVNATASATGGNTTIDATGNALTGSLAGDLVTVTAANSVMAAVTTPEMVLTNLIPGAVSVTGTNVSFEFTGNATNGVSIVNGGNVLTNDIDGGTSITIDTLGLGDIDNMGLTRVRGFTTTLTGNVIDAIAEVQGGTLAVTGTGSVNLLHLGTLLTGPTVSSSSGPVTFTNAGSVAGAIVSGTVVDVRAQGGGSPTLSGTLTGTTSVNAEGTAVTITPITPVLTARATAGSVIINDGANANLSVAGTATSNFSVTNTGNIATGQITASTVSPGTITLDTVAGGDITRISGRLTGHRAQFNNATNVTADVEVSEIGANASNDIVMNSFLATAVSPIDLTAGNDITFTSLDDATFTTLSAGNDVTLNIGGGLTTSPITVPNLLTVTAADTISLNVTTPQVIANSTTGDVFINGANLPGITVGGSAPSGIFLTTVTGPITANGVTADTVRLTSLGGDLIAGTGTLVGTTRTFLGGTTVGAATPILTQTPRLTVTGTGAVQINNTGGLGPAASTIVSSAGDVTFNNTGNVDMLTTSGNNVTVAAAGTVDNTIVTANTGTATVSGTSVAANVTADTQVLTGTLSDVTVTTQGATGNAVAMTASAGGPSGKVGLTGTPLTTLTGTLTGNLVTLDNFATATVSAVTPQISATNFQNLTINGTNPSLEVTASNPGAAIARVLNAGNIIVNDIAANFVEVDTQGSGSITRASGTLTGTDVFIRANGNSLGQSGNPLQTSTSRLTATANGDVFIDNNLALTGPVIVNAAGGSLTFNNTGDITPSSGQFSGAGMTVTSTGAIDANFNNAGLVPTTLQGTSIITNATSRVINATATAGSVTINDGVPPFLQVSGSATDAFNVTQTGQITAGPISATNSIGITALGGNDILQGGRLTAPSVSLSGANVTAETQTDSVLASATGNLVLNNFVTDPITADLTGQDVTFSTTGDVNFTNLNATNNLVLNLGQAVTGTLTGNIINVTGTTINATVTGSQVTANATAGDLTLMGTNPNLQVAATATGDVNLSNTGNIALNALQGVDITVNATGNVTNAGSNSFTGDNVTVTSGGTITTGNFAAGSASVSGAGDVQVGTVDTTVFDGVGGPVSVTSSGGAVTTGNVDTGGASGDGGSVSLSANTTLNTGSIDSSSVTGNGGPVSLVGASGITTGTINTSAPTGAGGTVTSNSLSGALNHGNITSTGLTGGSFTGNAGTTATLAEVDTTGSSGTTNADVTAQGDVEFARMVGTNVNITTNGNITDTSNTIVAENVGLMGNNIDVETEAENISIIGTGTVDVSNSNTDISSLSVSSGGSINLDTTGGVVVGFVSSSGGNVSLMAGGNIGKTGMSPIISGGVVEITAGGTITPSISDPFQIGASSGIIISAQGPGVAGAITGSVPASSVSVGSGSGQIFYNGVALNSPPSPPSSPPSSSPANSTIPGGSPEPGNALGQESSQTSTTSDDGPPGSEGTTGQSPTEKLVAQLTGATGGGDDGAPTEFLVTLEVDELGEVNVSLAETSPFDEAMDKSDSMSAEDVLDLDSGELNEVKVKVLYDPAQDRLVLAIDLSADDIIDLDLADYQELPVSVNYSIVGDAALMAEKLQADTLIDLQVEDLGNIPIKIIMKSGSAETDYLEVSLQDLMELPVYSAGE